LKKVFFSFVTGLAFAAGTANATDFSESHYPFPEHAVSHVQQNLIIEQIDSNESAYPRTVVRSSISRDEVLRDLAAYTRTHRVDEYRGN